MANLYQNAEPPDFGAWVPAAADDGMSLSQAIFEHPEELGKMHRAAERSQRLVDNINSRESSVEEAYDRRIKSVKDATGIELDNPERHRMTERERRQLRMEGVDEKDIPTYQRKLFDDRLTILQNAHPDKAQKLQFGDINEEAQAVAKNAEDEYEQARRSTKLGWGASLLAQFGGGFQGSLRDPLFSGSLLFGPTSAAGKTVAARMFSAAWRQGAFNAGITALEQPAVQAWRAQIGVQSGFTPAIENVGMSFLFGAIPGAVFRGVGEIPGALKAPLKRVLDGNPQPGDLEKAIEAANSALREIDGDIKPRSPAERAIRLGEEIDAADKAVRVPAPKDVTPELHDTLTQAAVQHAEDPSKPSPQAVAAVDAIEAWHGSPHDFDRFDLSKIGTGEGAQVRGHGAYLAEHPQVGEGYSKSTTEQDFVRKVQDLYDEFDSPSDAHAALAASTELTAGQKRLLEALERDDWLGFDYPHQAVSAALRDAKSFDLSPETLAAIKSVGNIYKTRINVRREQLLDLDKPMAQQSKPVRDAVKGLFDAARAKYQSRGKTGSGLSSSAAEAVRGEEKPFDELSGDVVRKVMERAYGPEETSRKLLEAGIPGSQFLDQGSRPNAKRMTVSETKGPNGEELFTVYGANEIAPYFTTHAEAKAWLLERQPETRNFVIFDDKLIDIVAKNDKPLHPAIQEVQQRLTEAQPQSRTEAEQVASEALEDIGTRQEAVRVREELQATRLQEPQARNRENNQIIKEVKEIAAAIRAGVEDALQGRSVEAIEAIGGDRLFKKLAKDWKVERENHYVEEGVSLEHSDAIVDEFVDYVLKDGSGKVKARASLGIHGDTATLADINLIDRNGDAIPTDRARNLLGPSVVRTMLREFKKDYPEVRTIAADRVSGARVGGEFDVERGQQIEVNIKPPPASSKDPLDKIPWTDEDGNVKLISAQNAARQGDRDLSIMDIIRECK